jgi:hypothetical protein
MKLFLQARLLVNQERPTDSSRGVADGIGRALTNPSELRRFSEERKVELKWQVILLTGFARRFSLVRHL